MISSLQRKMAVVSALALLFFACNKEEASSISAIDCGTNVVSYSADIKPIIDVSCAVSGCHVSGFMNGDFTSYQGLKAEATSGELESRVVDLKNMPPSNFSGPNLTTAQIELFYCWIEAGASEN